MPKPGFYAVWKGRVPGVYTTWDGCEEQVKGFADAKYKKFNTLREAEAFVGISSSALASSGPPSAVPVTKAPAMATAAKKIKVNKEEEGYDIVYSDGACKGNGGPGSVAGVGVWWGHNDPRNIAERCPGAQTNNRAELIAIARVLEETPVSDTPLMIKTDSIYSIKSLFDWFPGWESRGWRNSKGNPVLNIGVIRYIIALLALREAQEQRVRFAHVRGHSGIEGNEGADAQANLGALMPETPERDWDAQRVRVESIIEELEEEEEEPEVEHKAVQADFTTDDEEEYWREAGELDLDALDAPETDDNGTGCKSSAANAEVDTKVDTPATIASAVSTPAPTLASNPISQSLPVPKQSPDDEYFFDDILNPDELEAELMEAQGK